MALNIKFKIKITDSKSCHEKHPLQTKEKGSHLIQSRWYGSLPNLWYNFFQIRNSL